LLGDASYSIYLTHFLTLSVLAKLIWGCGAAHLIPQLAAYVLLAGTAIAVGVLCHLSVERPLLALLGQKRKSATQLPARLAESYPDALIHVRD
jgi:exopolysaccharide production protein ExoZ